MNVKHCNGSGVGNSPLQIGFREGKWARAEWRWGKLELRVQAETARAKAPEAPRAPSSGDRALKESTDEVKYC